MRLKTLEIKGFKSFADKTALHFDEGVTGIIGPNGCGKSNIVDSIRWVIGEHKISNLRSENLESLVFNGSKTRSASGLAEVSLTFENTKNLLPTEFSTVTITRKFYKSGESEYRLNDVSCRLKDIHNLFMDTGVSTDSYAIIELGMVDDIIKDKDNSRRRMLEQAAGISIYKTRKKEAKLKLDATETDLNRIEDLLFEINNQLKTLESQAKKAEKYYEIKKEYKTLSIELAKASLQGFNITYKSLTEQQEIEIDKKFKLDASIATAEAAIEQDKLAFIKQEKDLQHKQQTFNDLLQQLRTKENDKNLTTQKLQYLKEKETSVQDFLLQSEGQLKGLQESITFTHKQLQIEKEKLGELQKQLETTKENVDTTRKIFDDKRIAVDTARNENQQLQRNQFEAEKKVAVADTSIQNIQRTIQQLQEEREAKDSQLKQLQEEHSLKEQTLSEKKNTLTQLQQQHEQTKTQILETQAILENLRHQLAEENRKLDAKRNEYDLLKSLIDSMEGYPESVKFLHKNKNWNHAAPILSDIIYVKEEYRATVENVLEPYLNYYIVNNLTEGLQAVRLLDEHKKGKANFFLLDQFQHHATSAQSIPVNTLHALSIIEVENIYQPLANYLLGNVYIAQNEEALNNTDNDAIVLEKTGKYVKGKYTLSGGSVGLFEGKKIGRAKNIEKLNEAILQQENIVNNIKTIIHEHHNQVLYYNEQLKEEAIKNTQEIINQYTNQAFALQNKIENIHTQQAAERNREETLQQQLQTTQNAIMDVRIELEQLKAALTTAASFMQIIEGDYKNAEQVYNTANAQYNEYNLQTTRQQSHITALKQELEFKQKQLADLINQIESNNIQLKQTVENITESDAVLQEANALLLTLMRRKEEQQHMLNEADQTYHASKSILTDKETLLRQHTKSKEQLEQTLSNLKDKINALKLQLASVKERLSVEFKIDIDDILEEARKDETSLEELQASTDRIKKRLENMGEINPTAIEAYEEMKKRYDFIIEQKNDLVTAKESLLQTIQEVENTANQKFLDTFSQVRENFQKVFKTLFTEEDTADIILEQPENLANTGIDIVAKPKGKRPSSITQLSGGEKTLTATALLFAIYLIKPAPFCILDEVDAPLDDANVGKFTQMIRQFSNNSQFLIVTHNKMTMAAVDVIYGVTMQEPGVSRLVPVDFRGLN